MDYKKSFEIWLKHFSKNEKIINELKNIAKNQDKLIAGFSTDLKFGTAGLRGIMGMGPNRMNIYTVRKATQGLANYLLKNYSSPLKVAISYDSRLNSNQFAKESASVLAANGIEVFITKYLAPTPFLSFAVRELKCNAGIMITASHNPREYNGYKCYCENGAQMPSEMTVEVYKEINGVDIFGDVKISDFDFMVKNKAIKFVDENVFEKYIENVKNQSINTKIHSLSPLNITYTPLNGAGLNLVKRVLSDIGVAKINIVNEQEKPDGNFPTCKYPNPEVEDAFKLAKEHAFKNSSDIIIATDPDSDRVGVAVFSKNEYKILTGNQIGILLFNYLITQKNDINALPENSVLIRTIVSSKMVDAIAEKYNCKVLVVPTGFKNIGQKIFEMDNDSSKGTFLFGFEESNGYLVGGYTRDKDAVSASMLICEMASFYKEKGLTLLDELENLYKNYGYYMEKTVSLEFDGENGIQKIKNIFNKLKSEPDFKTIASKNVVFTKDYANSLVFDNETGRKTKEQLPKADLLEFILQDKSTIIVRPSGTEPKLKIYMMTLGNSYENSKLSLSLIESDFVSKIMSWD